MLQKGNFNSWEKSILKDRYKVIIKCARNRINFLRKRNLLCLNYTKRNFKKQNLIDKNFLNNV